MSTKRRISFLKNVMVKQFLADDNNFAFLIRGIGEMVYWQLFSGVEIFSVRNARFKGSQISPIIITDILIADFNMYLMIQR